MVYSGTWIFEGFSPTSNMAYQLYTTTNGGYVEYTFFGTGFELRGRAHSSYASNATITIDGDSNLSPHTTSAYGGFAFISEAAGTMRQDASDTFGSGLSVSGLSLGLHTVRITQNGTDSLVIETLDIITPIHINNTKVGSMSLQDLRANAVIEGESGNKIDMGKAKAWLVYDVSNNEIIIDELLGFSP